MWRDGATCALQVFSPASAILSLLGLVEFVSVSINRPGALHVSPQAVLFDTDNTLYPYDPAHEKAIEASREKACDSLSMTPEQFDELFARARDNVKKSLGDTASSHSRLLYFQRFIELAGVGTQLLLTLDLEQTYWRTFLTNCNLFDGILEFLDEIRAAGLPIAIVTDLTAQIQFRKIIYLGLDRRFDYVVTSEETGHDKPHPSSFERTVEKLGVPPEKIWMIGDSANDIVGARNAIGAVTFQKRHSGVTVLTGTDQADVVFDKFGEVHEIFSGIIKAEKAVE